MEEIIRDIIEIQRHEKRTTLATVCLRLLCIGVIAVYAMNSGREAEPDAAADKTTKDSPAGKAGRASGKESSVAPYADAEAFIDNALDYCAGQTGKTVRDLETEAPEDMVPYWDFDDPDIPNAPKDASAAAVVASGLIELAEYVDPAKALTYRDAAVRILRSLYSHYRGGDSSPAILLHSTGHKPAGKEIDYAIIYADYYYFEALLRMRRVENRESAVL